MPKDERNFEQYDNIADHINKIRSSLPATAGDYYKWTARDNTRSLRDILEVISRLTRALSEREDRK